MVHLLSSPRATLTVCCISGIKSGIVFWEANGTDQKIFGGLDDNFWTTKLKKYQKQRTWHHLWLWRNAAVLPMMIGPSNDMTAPTIRGTFYGPFVRICLSWHAISTIILCRDTFGWSQEYPFISGTDVHNDSISITMQSLLKLVGESLISEVKDCTLYFDLPLCSIEEEKKPMVGS